MIACGGYVARLYAGITTLRVAFDSNSDMSKPLLLVIGVDPEIFKRLDETVSWSLTPINGLSFSNIVTFQYYFPFAV